VHELQDTTSPGIELWAANCYMDFEGIRCENWAEFTFIYSGTNVVLMGLSRGFGAWCINFRVQQSMVCWEILDIWEFFDVV